MRTLTIKLDAEEERWLEDRARALKRSKGSIVRDLIARQRATGSENVGEGLADLCGSEKGSRNPQYTIIEGLWPRLKSCATRGR
jgi:predicted transcriptional regulator